LQVDDDAKETFLKNRRQDQQRALKFLQEDPQLQGLKIIQAPLLDLEVMGLPALQYFGSLVWKDEDGEGNGTSAP
jgi:arsenite/tail-anchored protein-transporting ATPase